MPDQPDPPTLNPFDTRLEYVMLEYQADETGDSFVAFLNEIDRNGFETRGAVHPTQRSGMVRVICRRKRLSQHSTHITGDLTGVDPDRIARAFEDSLKASLPEPSDASYARVPPGRDTVVNSVELDELRCARASLEVMLHELGLPKNVDVFKMRDHLRDLAAVRDAVYSAIEADPKQVKLELAPAVTGMGELLKKTRKASADLTHLMDALKVPPTISTPDLLQKASDLVELRETICREAGLDPTHDGEMTGAKPLAKAIAGMRGALTSRGDILDRINAALAVQPLTPWGEVIDRIAELRVSATALESVKKALIPIGAR